MRVRGRARECAAGWWKAARGSSRHNQLGVFVPVSSRAHLDGLERAQRHVGDELGAGAAGQVNARLVLLRVGGASEVGVIPVRPTR